MKTYSKPKVTVYGSLEQITRAPAIKKAPGAKDDPGSTILTG